MRSSARARARKPRESRAVGQESPSRGPGVYRRTAVPRRARKLKLSAAIAAEIFLEQRDGEHGRARIDRAFVVVRRHRVANDALSDAPIEVEIDDLAAIERPVELELLLLA